MTGIAFPKPEPRKLQRRRRRRHEKAWISSVRQEVFARDSRCRACGGIAGNHHLHEIVFRSATRGRPIEERINTQNCVRLCLSCHQAIHLNRLTVVVQDSSRGADGVVDFDRVEWSA